MKWFDSWFEKKFHYVIDKKANEIAFGHYFNSAKEAYEIADRKQKKKINRAIRQCRRCFHKVIKKAIRNGRKYVDIDITDTETENIEVLKDAVTFVIQEMTAMGYTFDKPSFRDCGYDLFERQQYKVEVQARWDAFLNDHPAVEITSTPKASVPITKEIAEAVDNQKWNIVRY